MNAYKRSTATVHVDLISVRARICAPQRKEPVAYDTTGPVRLGG